MEAVAVEFSRFHIPGRKYLVRSSPLTSFLSITPTFNFFPIAPLLTSSLLPTLLLPGRCFRTWILIAYQFYQLSLFLRSSVPTNIAFPSIFRKLVGTSLSFTLTLTVLLQRNFRLFLFSSAAALYTSLAVNAAKFSIFLAALNANFKFPKKEEVVSKRRKAFSAAHRSDENRLTYISPCLLSLAHTKLPISPFSIWHEFSPTRFQSFLVFALLFFCLEDIFYYSI